MQVLTLDGGGRKQFVHLQDMSVVTEGKGAATPTWVKKPTTFS
jgi:hypothetical protein